MIINSKNSKIGNKAMASVLLLYYHLIIDNGFTNDQTVYIELEFNAFDFLDIEVESDYKQDIDVNLLRQGAIIALICDINDLMINFDDDYTSQPEFKKIFTAFQEGKFSAIAEMEELFSLIIPEENFDLNYFKCLQEIYEKYVVNYFIKLLYKNL